MAHSTPHDWHSTDYVEAWVKERNREDPSRATHFDIMSKLLPIARNQRATILDIGAGYGPLAKVLIEAYPSANLVLQDFSQPMLKEAKERLSIHSDRVDFIVSDLMKADWAANIGPVEAIVSSMGLHNLGAPDRVREIYGEVFELIKPGGAFLDVDLVNGGDAAAHWLNSTSIMGKDADDPMGTSAWVAGTWRASASYVFPATVEEKLIWLRQSGFSVVDCWWKEMGRALVGGLKAPVQT